MTNYTPAPWIWTETGLEGPDGEDVLWVSMEADITARKPEDAQLIASAPRLKEEHAELVEALEQIRDHYDDTGLLHVRAIARAALGKLK